MDVLIRKASIGDAVAIARVHVDSWRTTYAGIVRNEYLDSLAYSRREELWSEILVTGEPKQNVYVAEDASGKVVGFAWGGPERSGNPTYQGEIYAIYLLDGYQRKGIGSRLTQAIAKELLAQGFASMLVWVLAENPFRLFYEALGAELVDQGSTTVESVDLTMLAYGWIDLRLLVRQLEEEL